MFLASIITANSYANAVITPEIAKSVILSNTDINRIVCQEGDINDVYFSQEKGMTVVNKNNTAFVKYLIRQQGGKKLFVTKTTELHIICNNQTYTLIAQPKAVNAQTIYLSEGIKARIEKNQEMFGVMDYEEKILHILQQIYRDEIPKSFRVKTINSLYQLTINPKQKSLKPLFDSIRITKIKDIKPEGLGLIAMEYIVTTKHQVSMLEADFLQPAFGKNIAAIALIPHSINPGETARLIIIKKSGKQ